MCSYMEIPRISVLSRPPRLPVSGRAGETASFDRKKMLPRDKRFIVVGTSEREASAFITTNQLHYEMPMAMEWQRKAKEREARNRPSASAASASVRPAPASTVVDNDISVVTTSSKVNLLDGIPDASSVASLEREATKTTPFAAQRAVEVVPINPKLEGAIQRMCAQRQASSVPCSYGPSVPVPPGGRPVGTRKKQKTSHTPLFVWKLKHFVAERRWKSGKGEKELQLDSLM